MLSFEGFVTILNVKESMVVKLVSWITTLDGFLQETFLNE